MSKPIQFVYIASILILAMAVSQVNSSVLTNIQTTKQILNTYSTKGTKELFKVFHFIFNKSYDYNTESGIEMYKTFRTNVQRINEHNAKKLSWTKGINHLTDMTDAEIKKHYNLYAVSPKYLASNLRSLKGVSLDDYNDDEENIAPDNLGVRSDVDHREFMRPVKDQGNCGSCWAFGTVAAIEGNFSKLKTMLTECLSEQQLVDCDTLNGGCRGGWYTNAMKFYYHQAPVTAANYPYVGVQHSCAQAGKPTQDNVNVVSYKYSYNANLLFASLLIGPAAVAVNANDDFYAYEQGIFDAPCTASVNHAMVLVGYAEGSWILRNSWGSDWGEAGHMRLKENFGNSNSCMTGRYGYRPELL
jgi:C1A family cysteine protease